MLTLTHCLGWAEAEWSVGKKVNVYSTDSLKSRLETEWGTGGVFSLRFQNLHKVSLNYIEI